MWEVLALEADTLPPELDGIAGDYGHRADSLSLSRRDDPWRDKISLVNGRVAALTRDGVRYELSPTTEPNAYSVLVKGSTHTVRIYHYCQGPRPAMPTNAQNMACPNMRSEKVPCSFSCATGFELSEPGLLVGSLACTASGQFTANSSCVRQGGTVPSSDARPSSAAPNEGPKEGPKEAPQPRKETPVGASKGWIAVLVVIGIAAAAVAIFFRVKGRRR